MTFAPLVGLVARVSARRSLVFGVRQVLGNPDDSPLPALLGLGALAVVTGGLHLDGLADLADGIGARRDAAGTLAVMRDPTVGAFAVDRARASFWRCRPSRSPWPSPGTTAPSTMIVGVLAGRLADHPRLRAPGPRPHGRKGSAPWWSGRVPRSRAAVVVAARRLASPCWPAGSTTTAAGPARALHALVALAGRAAGRASWCVAAGGPQARRAERRRARRRCVEMATTATHGA